MSIETLARLMQQNQLSLATVESCTGGSIAAYCTDLSGSSVWFNGGLVTYSNEMKIKLGVKADDIQRYGAVSESVVRQMAENGRDYCLADWAVAVTGIAGPTGGTPEKPVGTVWFGWSNGKNTVSEQRLFTGDRAAIRAKTVDYAIERCIELIQ